MRYDSPMLRHRLKKLLFRRIGPALLLALCVLQARDAAAETLRIGGTGAALGAMKLIAYAFEQTRADVSVKIYPSMGSSGAVRALVEGSLDIALSSRPLKLDELKHGLMISGYARTPLAAATRSTPSARELTVPELVRIYSGRTTAWPDGKRIRLVLRPTSDSDVESIRSISPEMSSSLDAAYERPGMFIAATDQDCAAAIEASDGTLGFITLSQFMTERPRVRLISLNRVEPSVRNLAAGKYPLSKSLFAVTKASPSPLVSDFMSFLRSAPARKIIEESGSLPLLSPDNR